MNEYKCSDDDLKSNTNVIIIFEGSKYCFSKETFRSLLSDPMCDQQTQDPVILTQNRKQVFEQWKRNQPVFLFKIFGGVVNNAFKMDLEECRTFEFIKTNDYSLFYRNSNEYNLKFRKLEIKVINKNENPIQEKDDLDKCIIKEDIFTNPLKLDSELIIFCFIKDPWPLQNKFEDFWGDFMAEHIEGLDCKFSEVRLILRMIQPL